MYTEALPAKYESGDHKGEQAYVKITNEKLGRPKTNPIQIEQDKFVFPQFGPAPQFDEKGVQINSPTEDEAKTAMNEVAENAGGWVKLLNYINASVRSDAVDSGKGYIRTAEAGEVDNVVAAGLKRTLEFTLKGAEKVTAKEIKGVVDGLLANLSQLSNDQIAEAIKALAK